TEPRQPGESRGERFDLLRCHRAADRAAAAPEKGPSRSYAHRLHGNPAVRGADIAGAGRGRARGRRGIYAAAATGRPTRRETDTLSGAARSRAARDRGAAP